MNKKFNSYHLTTLSPWPLVSSLMFLLLMMNMIFFLSDKILFTVSLIFFILMSISFFWWNSVIKESIFQGFHQIIVMNGLKMGMILFIVSEIMFFVSFFWAYFHSSISPNMEIGQSWPPFQIFSFNPMNVPLVNTIILLSSGVTITWSHHLLLKNNYGLMKNMLFITCLLGLYFTMLQGMEYTQASFCISDSIYGSVFFMATGFHGMHVIIGTSFLMVMFFRSHYFHLVKNHMLGFEMAAWYWHFVDMVWLFLYLSIYWWGN